MNHTEYKVKGMTGELYTVERTETLEDRPRSLQKLIESGKEPVMYWMARVIEGTRKQACSIPCWRFAGTDTFITIL